MVPVGLKAGLARFRGGKELKILLFTQHSVVPPDFTYSSTIVVYILIPVFIYFILKLYVNLYPGFFKTFNTSMDVLN